MSVKDTLRVGKMNYEEMSDFEINEAVSMFIPFNDCQWKETENDMVFICEHPINEPSRCTDREEFNPCNSPDDMWPLIVENEIGLNPPMSWETDPEWEAKTFNEDGSDEYNNIHTNPLRAAAIVFLKMQESK